MTILRKLETVFNDDGSVRSARGFYVSLDAQGADVQLGVKREADAMAIIPEEVRTVAELAALQAEIEAAETARVKAEEELVNALSDHETALAAKAGEVAALEARIAELTAPADPSVRKVATYTVVTRLEAAGLLAAANAALESDLAAKWRFTTADSRGGIDADAVDVRAFLTAIGADPDAILAPA